MSGSAGSEVQCTMSRHRCSPTDPAFNWSLVRMRQPTISTVAGSLKIWNPPNLITVSLADLQFIDYLRYHLFKHMYPWCTINTSFFMLQNVPKKVLFCDASLWFYSIPHIHFLYKRSIQFIVTKTDSPYWWK